MCADTVQKDIRLYCTEAWAHACLEQIDASHSPKCRTERYLYVSVCAHVSAYCRTGRKRCVENVYSITTLLARR